MRTSPEAIAGYSGALAAVLGGVRLSPLGVPHTKGKVLSIQIFSRVIGYLLQLHFCYLLCEYLQLLQCTSPELALSPQK
jgi:hypothetical protein